MPPRLFCGEYVLDAGTQLDGAEPGVAAVVLPEELGVSGIAFVVAVVGVDDSPLQIVRTWISSILCFRHFVLMHLCTEIRTM